MRQTADPNAKLTARELAVALGVSPQLVNTWHTDGYVNRDGERVFLPMVDRNWKGHRRFRYLDGAKAEAETRRSRHSFRKPRDWAALDRKPATRAATLA